MADLEFNKPILMYPKKQGRKYILSKHFVFFKRNISLI